MKYLILKTNDPYINLATEEYLLRNSEDDIFMLWQNSPVVVIGKNQNAYAEINLDYLKKHDIKIVRRITGGGAVYHDLGNVNYTFISSREKSKTMNFAYFTAPIIDALKSMGLSVELSGRNDLLCNGKKFSGNAQYTSETRILHHGTLLFNSDLTVLSEVLNVDIEKIESKAIKSTKSRVTNLCSEFEKDMTPNDFMTLIITWVKKRYNAEEIPIPAFEDIKELYERYSSDSWIYSDKKYLTEYTVRRKKRYPFGIVDIYLDIDREVIKKANVTGDFFGIDDVEKLENLLSDTALEKESLTSKLADIDVQDFIFGMSNEALVNHLLS